MNGFRALHDIMICLLKMIPLMQNATVVHECFEQLKLDHPAFDQRDFIVSGLMLVTVCSIIYGFVILILETCCDRGYNNVKDACPKCGHVNSGKVQNMITNDWEPESPHTEHYMYDPRRKGLVHMQKWVKKTHVTCFECGEKLAQHSSMKEFRCKDKDAPITIECIKCPSCNGNGQIKIDGIYEDCFKCGGASYLYE